MISVIVPVYNAEKYLEKCIESILGQTYQEFELLLINDGSTDGSAIIAKKYQEQFPERIFYFEKENEGVAKTRNFGLTQVKGDYFIFVDCDDFIDKKLLEQIAAYEGDIDIIKYKAIKTDKEGNMLDMIGGPVFPLSSGEEAFSELYAKDSLIDTPCLYAIRKGFMEEHHFIFSEGRNLEDFGLIPLMLIEAKKIVSIPFYGYYYRQVDNSITRNQDGERRKKNAQDALFHYDNMLHQIEDKNWNTKVKEDLKIFYTNAILLLTRTLDKADQKAYIEEIKKRKMVANIKIRNMKQFVKRIIISISIPLYLKLQK